MNRSRVHLLATLALAVTAAGCGVSPFQEASEQAPLAGVADMDAPGQRRSLMAEAARVKAPGNTATLLTFAMIGAAQPDRYLIKNATVRIECDDPKQAAAAVTRSASDAGGYVANLNESMDGFGRRSITVTVRVPATRFEEAMLNLESLGKVLHKQVTTQDVTEEYVDTESQSRNLKATEQRILQHLERAGTLDEILHVEKELSRVRQQIERLEGRIRFLSHRVAFSTLSVTLQETPAVESILPVDTFSIAHVLSEATRSLVGFGQVTLVLLIWVAVWSPVWIMGAIVIWAARRWTRKRATA